jgi:uncharacterized protein
LGGMYLLGLGTAADHLRALQWFTKAAEQNLATAQADLGVMYFNGRGTARDYAQAIAWFTKAASQGSAAAQANLGIMYLNGLGVSPDKSKAREWLQQAALQQNANAKRWLDMIDKQTPPPSQSTSITISSIAHSNSADNADAHNNQPVIREMANLH